MLRVVADIRFSPLSGLQEAGGKPASLKIRHAQLAMARRAVFGQAVDLSRLSFAARFGGRGQGLSRWRVPRRHGARGRRSILGFCRRGLSFGFDR